jgi:hypothetical protein
MIQGPSENPAELLTDEERHTQVLRLLQSMVLQMLELETSLTVLASLAGVSDDELAEVLDAAYKRQSAEP